MQFDKNGNYTPLHKRTTKNGSSNQLRDDFDNRIFPSKLQTYSKDNSINKIAKFVGGIPGAGKSKVVAKALEDNPTSFITIDTDEIRENLPEDRAINRKYKENASQISQPDAGLAGVYLRNECLNQEINYLLDSSFRIPSNPRAEITKAKDKGFKTEVYLLAVSHHEAIQGVLQRYLAQLEVGKNPRFVDPDFVKDAYKTIQDSAKEIKSLTPDTFKIYNREMELLYCNKTLNDVNPEDIMGIQNNTLVFWEKAKKEAFDNTNDYLIEKLKQNNAPKKVVDTAVQAKKDFLEQIKDPDGTILKLYPDYITDDEENQLEIQKFLKEKEEFYNIIENPDGSLDISDKITQEEPKLKINI